MIRTAILHQKFGFAPLTSSMPDSRQFTLLQGFRAIIAIVLVAFLAKTIDLGISTPSLMIAAVSGAYLAGRLLWRNARTSRVFFVHIGILASMWLVVSVLEIIFTSDTSSPASHDFLVFRYWDQTVLLLLAYGASLLTTWLFWTRRNFLTTEALALGAVFIWLLSGHRNYHLDAPKTVSALAWSVGLAPQHLLLAFGLVFTIFLGSYFVLAHERPLFFQIAPVKSYSRNRRFLLFSFPSIVLLILFAFAAYVNKSYSNNLSRASNGVGTEGKKEGESPLGFHSAIGQTRQPAALVRLEGDYEENPWLPMMYLREGALSSFNGREIVNAPQNFDRDIPRVNPGEPFVAIEKPVGEDRKEVTQSIYLLSQHSAPFGLDTPTAIRLLKNPDEKRFNLAYQVDSLAPTVKIQDLVETAVGGSDWDEETRAHYLRAPGSQSGKSLEGLSYSSEQPILDEYGEDLRYKLLAQELTKDAETPVIKAARIVEYLSKESIYTRKPGHTVTKGGDPVAPYLFSKEKRGYCVHFSHAAVYMMRLVGVPARIGTGYLTDLTYAKDGHILLHLGDRHAWPEIFIDGEGWTVLDVTPANAENEQVIIPDEKLLEELMSEIDPAQALVNPPPPAPQDPVEKSILEQVLTKRTTLQSLVILLISYLLLKLYIREGWRLSSQPQSRARLAYSAFAAHAVDLGFSRKAGETRQEYQNRLHEEVAINAQDITQTLEHIYYSTHALPSKHEIDHSLGVARKSIRRSKMGFRKLFSFLNPASITRWGRL